MISPPRVYETTFTVPAGTPINAPVSQAWKTEDNVISDVELYVPPGHLGKTGIRIIKGDVQLLPYTVGTFITADDYSRVFPIGVYIPTGDVRLVGYNTGVNPHSFFLRMTVTDYDAGINADQGSQDQALPAETITVVPDPLSPDAILGPDTVDALTSGDLTASDVAPIPPSDLVSTS